MNQKTIPPSTLSPALNQSGRGFLPQMASHKPERAEKKLWQEIRSGKLGFVFKRRQNIQSVSLDFYCPEKLLAIEIGEKEVLPDQTEFDQSGIRLIRFSSNRIFQELNEVIQEIKKALHINNYSQAGLPAPSIVMEPVAPEHSFICSGCEGNQ